MFRNWLLNSNLNKLIYIDEASTNIYKIPIDKLRVRRSYGTAILSAWRGLYAIFYIDSVQDVKIQTIVSDIKIKPDITYDETNKKIIITFDQATTIWGGISILPF